MNSLPLISLPISQSSGSKSNPNQVSGSQDEAFSSLLEQIVSEATQVESNIVQGSQVNLGSTASKSQSQATTNDQGSPSEAQSSSVPVSVSNQIPILNIAVQIPVSTQINSSSSQPQSQTVGNNQSAINPSSVSQTNAQTLAPLQDTQLISIQATQLPVLTQNAQLTNLTNTNLSTSPPSEGNLVDQAMLNIFNLNSNSSGQAPISTIGPQTNSAPSTITPSNQNSQPINSQVASISQPQSSTQGLTDNLGILSANQLNQNIAASNVNLLTTSQVVQGASQNSQTNAIPSNQTTSIQSSQPVLGQLTSSSQPTLNSQNINQSIILPTYASNSLISSSLQESQQIFVPQNQIIAQNISNNITSQILSNLQSPSVNTQLITAQALSGQIVSGFDQTNPQSSGSSGKTSSNGEEAVFSGLGTATLSNSSSLITPNQSISYHSLSIDAYQKVQNMVQDLRSGTPKDVEFLLEPPDLGKVKLNVSLDKSTNAVNMTFFVADDVAKHAIMSNIQDFRQILQSNGFTANNVNVYVGSDQKGQGFNQSFNQSIYPASGSNSTSFDSAIISGIQSLKSGVDVRV
ncbi:MAG: flagellar hook-length control protein FliK [Thermodesulfobium sp.]